MRSKYQEFSIKQGFVGTQTEPKLSPDSLIRGTQVAKNGELQHTILKKPEIAVFTGNWLR
jgi:hypothetical protein